MGRERPTPGPARRRDRRLALALGAALLTLLAVVLTVVTVIWVATGVREDSCEHATVARVPSPDGAWEARVDEDVCLYGFGVGYVAAGVHLVSTRGPARSADLLGVDTGAHEDERPRLLWTAPDVLQVTVPNRSFLKVLMREFDGVRVDLRFEPDDPADRAAWRRKYGMSPDPGP